jgi:hypothetical protein
MISTLGWSTTGSKSFQEVESGREGINNLYFVYANILLKKNHKNKKYMNVTAH